MCFETLIGIKECGEPEPKSKLYVDDYGITISQLDQLYTSDYPTGLLLFKSKRKAAGELISSLVNNQLASWMKADTIIDNSKIGFIENNLSPYDPALGAGIYVGVSQRLYNRDSFVYIFNSNVFLSADVNVEVELKIVDLNLNKVIDTITINTNENTIIDKEYFSNRNDLYIGIMYESTFAAQRTILREGYCGSCNGKNAPVNHNQFVTIQGIKGSIAGEVFSDLQGYAYTGGLQINYAVNCDRKAWICSNSKLFALAHIFKTNALLMQFAQFESVNERANTQVTINAEAAKLREDFYTDQFNKQMTTVLSNMRMPKDSYCFRCNENLKYSSMIP